MLNPALAYDIASERRRAVLAQAATAGRIPTARRAPDGGQARPASALLSRVRASLRPRTA